MIDHTKLYPEFDAKLGQLLAALQAHGLAMHGVEGFRTRARQDAIYAQGRTTPGPIVTHATAEESAHCRGCAVDLCFDGGHPYVGDWQKFGACVHSVPGLTWGGDFSTIHDYGHVEWTAWRNVPMPD